MVMILSIRSDALSRKVNLHSQALQFWTRHTFKFALETPTASKDQNSLKALNYGNHVTDTIPFFSITELPLKTMKHMKLHETLLPLCVDFTARGAKGYACSAQS